MKGKTLANELPIRRIFSLTPLEHTRDGKKKSPALGGIRTSNIFMMRNLHRGQSFGVSAALGGALLDEELDDGDATDRDGVV